MSGILNKKSVSYWGRIGGCWGIIFWFVDGLGDGFSIWGWFRGWFFDQGMFFFMFFDQNHPKQPLRLLSSAQPSRKRRRTSKPLRRRSRNLPHPLRRTSVASCKSCSSFGPFAMALESLCDGFGRLFGMVWDGLLVWGWFWECFFDPGMV